MTLVDGRVVRTQRRTIALLVLAQVFSGLATGAALSVGSLLAVDLAADFAGDAHDAWAGSVTTTVTLGAAIASALLVRVAVVRGRRVALTSGLLAALAGALLMIVAVATRQFWLLLVAALLVGAGTAVNLQARFAATDLSDPHHRGRDLSLVVWMSTVGSVAGPNLVAPGQSLAALLDIPALTGVFVFSSAAMSLGILVIWVGLRPDPLLEARRLGLGGAHARPRLRDGIAAFGRSRRALAALTAMLVAHFVMVAIMAMTPVHLTNHGGSVAIVGLTISLHIAGMYALAPVMGLASDRLGPTPVMIAGLVVLVVSGLLAGLSGSDHVLTTVGLVLLGLGWSAATVAASAAIVDAVGEDVRVAAQGVADSSMSLAGALGGLLGGAFLAVASYAGLGVACALLSAVAVPAVLIGMRDRGR